MINQHSELEPWGWSAWFEQRLACKPTDLIARVAADDREQLLLVNQNGQFRAKLAGSFLHRHLRTHAMPCVGDWVCLRMLPGDGLGVVHTVLERRTTLRRKTAGNAIEHQMIAANVDVVVIVQASPLDFNLNRLERYLVMVREGGAEPYILLTKTDLMEPDELAEQVEDIRASGITAPIGMLSNVTREGVEELRRTLVPGKTYCFVGSSGVGKSTLINLLMGHALQETQEVSGTGEGRHTTVRRELILLTGGALVIDNPGMREFGIVGADEGMEHSFADIAEVAAQCRYRDCGHTNEPGCAVLAAIEAGELCEDHVEHYQKLKDESAFNQMSYAEKRKKDRNFGRMIKSVKRDLKEE